MSAGTGVLHSEQNPSRERPVHFLQIWVLPARRGIAPGYEQKAFPEAERRGRLRVVASPDGRDGSVSMNQDALLYAGLFNGAEHADLPLGAGRRGYVHVARGEIEVNGRRLRAGDALKLDGVKTVELKNGREAEVLVFDLP